MLSVLAPLVIFFVIQFLFQLPENINKGHTSYLGVRLYFCIMLDDAFCFFVCLFVFFPTVPPCFYVLHRISPHEETKSKSLILL